VVAPYFPDRCEPHQAALTSDYASPTFEWNAGNLDSHADLHVALLHPGPITSSKTTRTRPEVAADVSLGPRLELATAPAHLDVGRGPPGAICWSPLDHLTGRTVQTEVGSAWPSIRVHDEPVVVCGHPSQVTVVVINKCLHVLILALPQRAVLARRRTVIAALRVPRTTAIGASCDPCFAVGRHVQGSSDGRRGLGSDASGHRSLHA
jgi:hypothetical protein